MKPCCWKKLRKKKTIFSLNSGVPVHELTSPRNPAGPLVVTAVTSSSVGGRPVSRFLTLRTALRAEEGSNGGGVTPPLPPAPPAPAPPAPPAPPVPPAAPVPPVAPPAPPAAPVPEPPAPVVAPPAPVPVAPP